MASSNTKRSRKKTDSLDLYNTSKEALEAAYNAGIFDAFSSYLDPCSGLGKISTFLREKGKSCISVDVKNYGYQDSIKDFLTSTHCYGVDCIVMNPPYLLSEAFINHALKLCNNVVMFNRAAILESDVRSKLHHAKAWPLESFYSFANRVTCSEGEQEKETSTSVWYGWFIYQKGYEGSPKIKWLFLGDLSK